MASSSYIVVSASGDKSVIGEWDEVGLNGPVGDWTRGEARRGELEGRPVTREVGLSLAGP